MPLVTVAGIPHAAEKVLLTSVADAVADALGLGHGDVIAMSTPVRSMAVSGPDPAEGGWLLVSIHGSDRGEDKMRLAREAAAGSARAWSHEHVGPGEGVWVEWILP